jgi:replicative DNA helicase
LNNEQFTTQVFPWRGVSKETFMNYGVLFKVDSDGKPVSVSFPYLSSNGEAASKERRFDQKNFFSIGPMNDCSLFGQNVFSAGSAKAVTITEGEMDAMSVFQMLGSKYPAVSVRSASSARKDCEKARDYLNSFEKIYICFDNDEPGQRAVKDVSQLFDVNKVVHVKLDRYKDANEYLTAGQQEEFKRIWWNAKPYMPKGVIADYNSIEALLREESGVSIASYPFVTLQGMTYGIRQGEVILLLAQEKVGKVLRTNTPLPTPTGWTTIGALKEGDDLFAADGTICKVTYVTPVHTRPYYKVTFSDKTFLEAGDNHRWTVRDLNNNILILNTEQLYNTEGGIIAKGSKAKYVVPNIEAVELPEKDLPIDPYLLGIWLADGQSSNTYITVSKKKLDKMSMFEFGYLKKTGNDCYTIRPMALKTSILKKHDLYRNKHIPLDYLRASKKQREELFKGLCFDGWAGNNGKQQNEFYSSNKILFDQVVELARSLGYIVTESAPRVGKYKDINGSLVECKTAYRFRYRKAKWKAIRSIEPIGNLEGRCLTVDHDEHLFAAGEGWTLTHNTEVMRAIEYHLLKDTDFNIGIIHLEEEEKRSVQGLIGYELGVPAHLPDSGLSVEDQVNAYKSITKREGRLHFYSHFGSDDPNTILDIIRYLVSVCHCKFIFLDHITMLVTGFEDDDERKKLDFISTRLAMMTRELDFTLFMVSHVNDDGKTRGSRNISKIADLIISLDRDIEAASYEERNKTHLTVRGNRFAGLSGPAGVLNFDPASFTLAELVEEPTVTDFDPGV